MATEQEATSAAEEELIDVPVTADLSTGRILLAAREEAGLSEKDIADQLHITVHYVKALETDHYEKLPGPIFVKGYIKSYAVIVGADPDRLVRLYNEHTSSQENEAKEQTRLQAKRRKDKNLPWVIVSVLVFVSGFLGLWFYNTRMVAPAEVVVEQPEPLASASSSSAPSLQTLAERTNNATGTVLDRVVAGNPSVSPAEVAEEFSSQLVEEIQSLATQASDDIEDISNNEINTSAAVASDNDDAVEADAPTAIVSELSPGDSDTAAEVLQQPAVLETAEQESTEQAAEPAEVPAEVVVESEEVALAPEAEDEPEVAAVPEVGRTLTIGDAGSDSLRFEFDGESWVEVADASSTILYRDIRVADDVLIIRGQAPFNVLVGNASRTVLTLNGAIIDIGARMRIDNTARITVGR